MRPSAPVSRPGAYDLTPLLTARTLRATPSGVVYIPADELEKAGFDPEGPPPFYRVWGSSRGGLFVRLYKEA